jgi:hypothetical protein
MTTAALLFMEHVLEALEEINFVQEELTAILKTGQREISVLVNDVQGTRPGLKKRLEEVVAHLRCGNGGITLVASSSYALRLEAVLAVARSQYCLVSSANLLS